MMYYTKYRPGEGALQELLQRSRAGRLVTAGANGDPAIGVFPYLMRGGDVELHLVRSDPQVAQLRENPRCLFEVGEIYSAIPSYWVDEAQATYADIFYVSAALRGGAEIRDEPAAVVAHLDALLERYQGAGRHEPVAGSPERYAAACAQLVLVTVRVEEQAVKFKLGQQEPAAVRRRIREELERRGEGRDAEAAAQLRRLFPALGGAAADA